MNDDIIFRLTKSEILNLISYAMEYPDDVYVICVTPTGIGDKIVVSRNDYGNEVDITDYSGW